MSLKSHVLSLFRTCIASSGRSHGPLCHLTSVSYVFPLRIADVYFLGGIERVVDLGLEIRTGRRIFDGTLAGWRWVMEIPTRCSQIGEDLQDTFNFMTGKTYGKTM